MKHVDEEIVKNRNQMAKEQEQAYSEDNLKKELEESIFEGPVHIYGQLVEFENRLIPELKLKLVMPQLFFLVDDQMKKLIYPLGNPPSHVFGSGEINFNLALSCSPTKIPNEGIPKFLPMANKLMQALGPKSRIISQGVIDKEGWNFAILEFVTRAVDMNVYNVMFYFSIENQLMIGTINFPAKYQKRLVKIAKEMIDSLELLQFEENSGHTGALL